MSFSPLYSLITSLNKKKVVGDSTYIEWGDPDKFFEGVALFKAGKAQKLVFTGGKMPWENAKKTEGAVLRE